MKFVFIFLILFFTSCFVSAGDINVIDLNNKTAEDVIPLIEPLLQENDALTGTGYQLILRADDATLRQIKSLLDKIDTRPRNLMISVRNATDRRVQDRGVSTSGSVTLGDHSQTQVNVHGTDRRSNKNSDVLQKVRVLEGEKAFISAGESVPYRTRQIYQNGHWVTVRETVDYEDVGNSFYAVPRIQGERVVLEIEPVHSSVDRHSGNIEYQSVETRVSGKLGEWIPIGVIDEQEQSRSNGILSTHRAERETRSNIEVKVEVQE